jgi:hypothetical protein
VRLPSGVNTLTLTATDVGNSSSASDIVIITVDVAGAAGVLESAARTTNEQSMGRAMDSMCQRMLTLVSGEGVPWHGPGPGWDESCLATRRGTTRFWDAAMGGKIAFAGGCS